MTPEEILKALHRLYYLIDTQYPDLDAEFINLLDDLNRLVDRKRAEIQSKH